MCCLAAAGLRQTKEADMCHRPSMRIRFLLGFLVLFTSLSGCAAPPSLEPPSTPVPVSPTSSPTQTLLPPTETATVEPTPTDFVPRAVIKIAVHVPLSGPWMGHGVTIRQSALLAL